MSIKGLMRLGRETQSRPEPIRPAHAIESTFRAERCRFELACCCGAVHDTPYIDEALEWRELHLSLAPLADQLHP